MVYGKGSALRHVKNEMVEHAISSPFTAKYLLKMHGLFRPARILKVGWLLQGLLVSDFLNVLSKPSHSAFTLVIISKPF